MSGRWRRLSRDNSDAFCVRSHSSREIRGVKHENAIFTFGRAWSGLQKTSLRIPENNWISRLDVARGAWHSHCAPYNVIFIS